MSLNRKLHLNEIENNPIYKEYINFLEIFLECFRHRKISDSWCIKHIWNNNLIRCYKDLYETSKKIPWFYDSFSKDYDLKVLAKYFNQRNYYRGLEEIWLFAREYFIDNLKKNWIITKKIENQINQCKDNWEALKILYYEIERFKVRDNIDKELKNIPVNDLVLKIKNKVSSIMVIDNAITSYALLSNLLDFAEKIKFIIQCNAIKNFWLEINFDNIDISINPESVEIYNQNRY
ncbi:MAG: hypothetical protein ACD_4C00373G0002 [uncultured bacterium (gcode 4)]|uniref:Uncharacterized protein n=1 Tax=uncultured bacterium (gcode 4) TaxID=1234023 RepID=K2FWH1_9BACT|nr:MAG: hypothetical protein ACD_4C00373G0002 [uncultured bacterium (gcode 4)]